MLGIDWNKLTSLRFDFKELISIVVDSANIGFPEHRARSFVYNHWYFAVQCSIIYFFLIFSIKHYMKNREPFHLQYPLNIWNAMVALCAVAATYYMSADFFGVLWKYGFRASYCGLYGLMEGTTGFWMWLFILSKLPLLADTFFIVLRKKPLLFRHYYHHILTFLHCFFTYPVTPAYNRWGAYLNIFSHAITYSYYFFSSIVVFPRAVAKTVSTEQIMQFVISIIVLVTVGVEHYVLNSFSDCAFDVSSFWMASFMDLTYLFLFVKFFLESHVQKGGKEECERLDHNGNKKND